MAALLRDALAGKTDGVNFLADDRCVATCAAKDKLGDRMTGIKPPDRMRKIACALS
jgi:hypothetical protein